LEGCEGFWLREGTPELDGGIDHLLIFRDDFGTAGHAPKMVAGVAIVVLDGDGAGLADDVAFGWENLGEGFPSVGVENALCQVLDLVVESLEGCSITTADNPGNSSP